MSLSSRVALAIAALVGGSTIVFATIVWLMNEQFGAATLDTLIRQDTVELEELMRSNASPLPAVPGLLVFLPGSERAPPPPPEIAELPPGQHHGVRLNQRIYHVGVVEIDGQQAYLALDITISERRERALALLLLFAVVLVVALASLAGLRTARQITAPIRRLTTWIGSQAPGAHTLPVPSGSPEVDQIAAAVAAFADRSEAALARERLFTEAASHELRTPVAVMRSSTELLALTPDLPAALQGPAQRAQRAAERMGVLIEGLLLLGREPAAESAAQETVDVARVLGHCAETARRLQGPDGGSRVVLAATAQPQVPGHAAFLDIAVSNLLANALAVSAAPVTLRIESDRVSVSDQGPGLAGVDLTRLFERGYKHPDSAGSGLGLYIADIACRRCGWQLRLAPGAVGGTVATIRFGNATPGDEARSTH